jgi:ribosomal protein S18 acetylase RimI-like enzyme
MRIGVTLRPAARSDVEFLYSALRASLRDYVEATDGGWDDAHQRALFVDTIDLSIHQVIEIDGRDAGCLAVEEFVDRIALNRIFLLPEAQGRGVGTAMIQTLNAGAHARGLPVVLSVQKVNTAARALYQRLGFAVVTETSTHYGMEAAMPDGASR